MKWGFEVLFLACLVAGFAAGSCKARHWLFGALRTAAILVSCVVMAWVPIVFAMADAAPEIRCDLKRSMLLIWMAFRDAEPMQRVKMVTLLTVLSPVLLAVLALDVFAMVFPHIQVQLVIWCQSHQKALKKKPGCL